jgi:hypothetical protein
MVSLPVLVIGFIWVLFCVYGHVIHVDHQPFLSDFSGKDEVHHSLKGGWGVSKPEEHNGWLE